MEKTEKKKNVDIKLVRNGADAFQSLSNVDVVPSVRYDSNFSFHTIAFRTILLYIIFREAQ